MSASAVRPPTHRTPRIVAGAAVLLLASGVLPSVALDAASAAPATCDGRAATIVGPTSASRIDGTPGPDVIVTDATTYVDADAGDDLICVTGRIGRYSQFSLDAGAGDDVVRNDSTFAGDVQYTVDLGAGDDTYTGNRGSEDVRSESGTDDIATAGGSDHVFVGSFDKAEGTSSGGRISLGSGGGSIRLAPTVRTDTVIDGGQGGVLLTIDARSSLVDIDAPAQRATVEGRGTYTFSGVTSYWANEVGRFTGTNGDDRLSANHVRSASFGPGDDRFEGLPGDVDLGPGDDVVSTYTADNPGGTIVGGAGRDGLELTGSADTDIAEGVIRPLYGQPLSFGGIEELELIGNTVMVTGSDAADVVQIHTCTTTARMGAGDDRVTLGPRSGYYDLNCGTTEPARLLGGQGDDVINAHHPNVAASGGPGDDRIWVGGRISGGPGDDRLSGRAPTRLRDKAHDGNDRIDGGTGNDVLDGRGGDDLLLGRGGRDQARGGGGVDTCRTEVRRACER